ncbi:ArsA-related P-loop ATPase [Geodermatophilus sp. DSM 44513]|uniref:ArsA family ATPase n=1 Tax=Geodermatophilus sp. DSM 44513 TaxID=1528104 RepID=UPI00127F72D9|nr:ArsA-related P-loop ATPase [Geodermatophilus sp. DSM 44513]WNV77298.1 ArsA-related P-loop ATPase [Geodermatophilus sp. DSM 44513]
MRTLLLTGPGGAGTSTLAAATALRAAAAGGRTLLLRRPGCGPAGLDAVPGLVVDAVTPLGAVESLWASADDVLAAVPGLTPPPPSSVVPVPGAGQLALLARVARAAAGDEADTVVVDAGPLEDGVALVGLPAALRWWLDQALPTRLRVLAAVRTAAVRSGTVVRGPLDTVLDALPAVDAALGRLVLDDPAAVEVRLVAQARASAVPALRRAVTALALHGQQPAAVLARVLPGGGPGEWWAGRAAEQERALAGLAELAPLHRVRETAAEPAGIEALAGLLPPGDGAAPVALLPSVNRREGRRRLVLPLPFAEREGLDLTRWQDDLVVTVAGARRSLRLDSLLRRCVVTGGTLADAGTPRARLEVTFTPDPQQWPADLLAAEGSSS